MKRKLFFSFLFLFTITTISTAQQQEKPAEQEGIRLQLKPQEQQRNTEMETRLLEAAYEQAIDPETYRVGPGDYLSITIWGDIQRSFQLPVTPEGLLIIPTVGPLDVDGLTLHETQAKVKTAVLEKYKQKNISTNLLGMRKIRVHVTGEVKKPGTYSATPIDRVSDLISRADGLSNAAFVQGIKIKHLTGEETLIDFSIFQEKGDLEQNPFLRGGDIIVIPPIDYSQPIVKVEGFVETPGYYPLKPDESLFDFLTRHHLIDIDQKITQVVVRHSDDDSVIDLTTDAAHNTLLKNGDELLIPKDVRQVYVIGAVQKPGMYPYVENLTAKDYVGEAGPTENAGSLGRIRVRHVATGETDKGGEAAVDPGDVVQVPVRRRWSDYLQVISTLATFLIAYSALK